MDDVEKAFAAYVAARRAALLRTAYLLTGSVEDAEDLVQVALINAVPKWGRISDNPEPYVRKILARESVNRWRGRRWREVHTDAVPEVAAATPGADDRMVLYAALRSLAPRQRAVVVLRFYDDLTERETAEMLGISIGTVKSQARDALARLRSVLGTDFLDPADETLPV